MDFLFITFPSSFAHRRRPRTARHVDLFLPYLTQLQTTIEIKLTNYSTTQKTKKKNNNLNPEIIIKDAKEIPYNTCNKNVIQEKSDNDYVKRQNQKNNKISNYL